MCLLPRLLHFLLNIPKLVAEVRSVFVKYLVVAARQEHPKVDSPGPRGICTTSERTRNIARNIVSFVRLGPCHSLTVHRMKYDFVGKIYLNSSFFPKCIIIEV